MAEPPRKKQKPQSVRKKLIINAFTHGYPHAWRHPDDTSRGLTNSTEPWIEFAQTAERGKLHAIFIADHLTFFDVFKGPGNFKDPARAGMACPRLDPSAIAPLLCAHTKNIGLGITFSTVSEHPYLFSRRLASLDHVTGGRIGWNIVSSYLNSIGEQLLNGEPLPEHDARYSKTEEYLDVVYKLLLSSWRDDAVVYDKANGVFTDPDRIRGIKHKGEFFSVPGPAITEPSVQRFPVVIQAGTSDRGLAFGACNAEVVFIDDRDKKTLKAKVAKIRQTAAKFGRDPYSVKCLIASMPIIGKTHEDAEQKLAALRDAAIDDYAEIGFGGISGVDLSKFGDDEPIQMGPINNLRSTVEGIIRKDENKGKKGLTKKQIITNYKSRSGSLFGSYTEVADEIERWIEEYDIDGLNLACSVFPDTIKDIVDLLIPELQRRGIFQTEYAAPGGTYRENLFGAGQTYFSDDHPAHKLRWTSDLSEEDFEKQLEEAFAKRDKDKAEILKS